MRGLAPEYALATAKSASSLLSCCSLSDSMDLKLLMVASKIAEPPEVQGTLPWLQSCCCAKTPQDTIDS